MKYLLVLIATATFAQQTQWVDFKSVTAKISLNPIEKSVSGLVAYTFDVLQPTDTIKIDAQNMQLDHVMLDNHAVTFVNTKKQLLLVQAFPKGSYSLSFNYTAQPKQALYFVGSTQNTNLQIWTQGQGRYTSNWFPSFDDVNEKLVFNLEVDYDSDYEVVSNGVLTSKTAHNGTCSWKYTMKNPMSSYLLMLAVGKYQIHHQKAKSGVPLDWYLEPKDSSKYEPTYRHATAIFDFLEKEIGVPYPWQIYKQLPVRDFLYAGMENTSATLFSRRYVVDSIGFEDRNYTNIHAHELAHQWFGNLITAQSGKHHWLQEGFATYYAWLAEREIYGDDYFYHQLHQAAQQIKYASRTDSIPVLHAKASSLSFYQKGAWALFVLHQSIGDRAFQKVVRNYLEKYAYKTVTTADFFEEITKVTKFNTQAYSKVWLESVVFNTQQANELLLKNKSIQKLFEVEKLKNKPLADKAALFAEILQGDAYFEVKKAIVNQLKTEKIEAKSGLLLAALATNNVPLRQAVALTLPIIPATFRSAYQTLLQDKSYQTQEIALYYLWRNFPEMRVVYLEQTQDAIGFNDYNLKILWLSLALATPEYSADKTMLSEALVAFSSADYETITRQNALQKLLALEILNNTVLKNLVGATTHHTWQFSKFGRDSIRLLLQKPAIRASFEAILPSLDPKEQFQLNRLLLER
ncbi:M1 family metallopeptidase [Flavobacterium crassostreae]|uniref:Aminopeptidase N n=1 Tax=Flavobacterium crassostreae TaxID=1763534 RepID=A0A1B9EA14_9FLAO|nr:M1 family metallopeptidase [Flavobacterium crassostreae]OCB78783.1 aminopeptidase [Flavobacterium crassostreae]